jgi:hypothetical protein
MKIYLIGSLRRPEVPLLAATLRSVFPDWTIFDDWYAAGPNADDSWRDYERNRGHLLPEALQGEAAQHVFHFDRKHLSESTVVVLVLPAGKSGHLELGWALGQGKYGYILLDNDPERYDVMYAFADGVYSTTTQLVDQLRKLQQKVG